MIPFQTQKSLVALVRMLFGWSVELLSTKSADEPQSGTVFADFSLTVN